MTPDVLKILLVASSVSLFMAWTIGAGSSGSTPFAPAVGANAISVMRAGFLVGILGFAGAIIQGANVSSAVGTELVAGVTLSPTATTISLLTAGVLVAIGVFTGYPIATAFTVTGAVIGSGLAIGGEPAWAKYRQIAALWVLTPIVCGGIAYTLARLLRWESTADRIVIPALGAIVGVILANMEFIFLGSPGESASVAKTVDNQLSTPAIAGIETGIITVSLIIALLGTRILARGIKNDADSTRRRFLLVLGGLVAFSAGGSQVGLAVGPLLPLFEPTAVPFFFLLLGGGCGLLLGSWMGAPRMIKSISQDYSALGPNRSIAALIPSFAIAQTAVFFGVPVSFNEIIISAITGSGVAANTGGISRKKIGYTLFAWIGSLTAAFGVSYGAYELVHLLP